MEIEALIPGPVENIDTLMDPTKEIRRPSFLQICRSGSKFWSAEELFELGRDFLQLDIPQPPLDTALFLRDPIESTESSPAQGKDRSA